MLVNFTCKSHADITMFGDVAKRLLQIIGHSGTIPGALRPRDIPEAIERLKRAIEAEAEAQQDEGDDDDENRKVSLSQRAWPLIDLLKSAHENDAMVMWDRYGG
jgi:hypothetical protein